MKKRRGIGFCFILLTASVFADTGSCVLLTQDLLENHELEKLTNIVLSEPRFSFNDEEARLLSIKNTPREKPEVLDLTEEPHVLFHVNPKHAHTFKPRNNYYESERLIPLSRYDEGVLRLRAGDVVKLKDSEGRIKIYAIGKFLGASSPYTHEFEILGRSKRTLVLPFLVESERSCTEGISHTLRDRERAAKYLYRLARQRPLIVPDSRLPEILEVGKDFSYLIFKGVYDPQESGSFLMEEYGFVLNNVKNLWPPLVRKDLQYYYKVSEDEANLIMDKFEKLHEAIQGMNYDIEEDAWRFSWNSQAQIWILKYHN